MKRVAKMVPSRDRGVTGMLPSCKRRGCGQDQRFRPWCQALLDRGAHRPGRPSFAPSPPSGSLGGRGRCLARSPPGHPERERPRRFQTSRHLPPRRSARRGDPTYDAQVNVLGLRKVLEASVQSGAAKVIFASSAASYGSLTQLPITEDSPRSHCGITKMASRDDLATRRRSQQDPIDAPDSSKSSHRFVVIAGHPTFPTQVSTHRRKRIALNGAV